MKMILFCSLLLVNCSIYALRCGNDLVNVGDTIGKVMQSCVVDNVYRIENNNADILKIYTKQGGMNYEITIIDGKIYAIDGSRF